MPPRKPVGIKDSVNVAQAFQYNNERNMARHRWQKHRHLGAGIMCFFDHVMWADIKKEADEFNAKSVSRT